MKIRHVAVAALGLAIIAVVPAAFAGAKDYEFLGRYNGQRAVFDELRQGIRDIEFLSNPTEGEVRIACPELLSAGLLPATIDRLSRRHPISSFGSRKWTPPHSNSGSCKSARST